MRKIEVYPVPFVGLEQQDEVLRRLAQAGADGIHWDVMDGRYNKNNTLAFMGPESIRRARASYPDLPFEAHLMMEEPWNHLREYAEAKCYTLIPHLEAFPDPDSVKVAITSIWSCAQNAGLALEPGTPVERVFPHLPYLDLVLLMTARTGYPGQEFIDRSGEVRTLRKMREGMEYFRIEVDGGMDRETSRLAREAGADRIVAASHILNSEDFAARIRELRGE